MLPLTSPAARDVAMLLLPLLGLPFFECPGRLASELLRRDRGIFLYFVARSLCLWLLSFIVLAVLLGGVRMDGQTMVVDDRTNPFDKTVASYGEFVWMCKAVVR